MKININDSLKAAILRQSGNNFQLANELQDNLSKESKLYLLHIIERLESKKMIWEQKKEE